MTSPSGEQALHDADGEVGHAGGVGHAREFVAHQRAAPVVEALCGVGVMVWRSIGWLVLLSLVIVAPPAQWSPRVAGLPEPVGRG